MTVINSTVQLTSLLIQRGRHIPPKRLHGASLFVVYSTVTHFLVHMSTVDKCPDTPCPERTQVEEGPKDYSILSLESSRKCKKTRLNMTTPNIIENALA